jgi:hypothetical protein
MALLFQENPMTRTQFFSSRRLLLAAAVLAGAVAAPAFAEPPPWAPAHGHRAKQQREYRYVYYPQQQVYFAPATSQWFWLSGGQWQFGVNLPLQYSGYARNPGVPVILHSSRPYAEHVYVEQNYGRPWREKHKKQKKYKEKHQDRHHDGDDRHRRDDRHGHRD